ncbi:hypothetical protein LJR296_007868 [Cupriavidus necator]|uniref:hypothetical protein n=1 Tax=Cupriavidus necator TaxID=106590 RepID=UPI003ED15362
MKGERSLSVLRQLARSAAMPGEREINPSPFHHTGNCDAVKSDGFGQPELVDARIGAHCRERSILKGRRIEAIGLIAKGR